MGRKTFKNAFKTRFKKVKQMREQLHAFPLFQVHKKKERYVSLSKCTFYNRQDFTSGIICDADETS